MIRPLNENDLDAFLAIRMDRLHFNPEAFSSSFSEQPDREKTRQDLKEKNEENFILGYFEEDTLLGMVGFARYSRQKHHHKGGVWGMFVYPEQRGKGIGKALMQACMEKASRIVGLEKVNLSVIAVQKKALQLYRNLGFVEYGVEKDALKVIGRNYDEVFMSWEIVAQ